MNKFETGDRVRLKENYGGCNPGTLGTVKELKSRSNQICDRDVDLNLYAVDTDNKRKLFIYGKRLELVKAAGNTITYNTYLRLDLKSNYEYMVAIVAKLNELGLTGEPMSTPEGYIAYPMQHIFVGHNRYCFYSRANYNSVMGEPISKFVPITLDGLYDMRKKHVVTLEGKDIEVSPELYASLLLLQ